MENRSTTFAQLVRDFFEKDPAGHARYLRDQAVNALASDAATEMRLKNHAMVRVGKFCAGSDEVYQILTPIGARIANVRFNTTHDDAIRLEITKNCPTEEENLAMALHVFALLQERSAAHQPNI